MTQIATVEDLIEILNADPEIRHKLFEAFGLSAMPELFRRMDTFEDTQQRMLETLGLHSETLQTHSEILARHSETLAQHSETLAQHTELLQAQGEMLRRHGEILKEHSDSLRILREDVSGLRSTTNELSSKFDDLNAMVRGEQVERKAFNVVSGQLSRIADKRIRRIEPILNQSGAIYYNMQHMWPVHDARADGKISDSDHDRLMVTDVIFRAYFQQVLHLFPVEVSNTISEDDVDRAARSADILKKVFDGAETTPIVAGTLISPWVEMHAENLGVKVVTFVFERAN